MMDDKQPEEVLKEIIAHWPVSEFSNWPKDEVDKLKLRRQFKDYITDAFNVLSFAIRLDPKQVRYSDVVITGNYAKILVYDRDPLLAVLKKQLDNSWRLEMLDFQCATCFGSGIDYRTEICNVCGGTGWGMSGSVEFCSGLS